MSELSRGHSSVLAVERMLDSRKSVTEVTRLCRLFAYLETIAHARKITRGDHSTSNCLA